MKILSIKIEKLFDLFDYDIKFPDENDGNVLILTGPNGFGKTQILNIIFHLFNRNFLFFERLIFERIELVLEQDVLISIEKQKQEKIIFILEKNGTEIDRLNYEKGTYDELIRQIARTLPFRRISKNEWIDHRNDRILSGEEIVIEYHERLSGTRTLIDHELLKQGKFNDFLSSVNVYLIREQRLFIKVPNIERTGSVHRDQTLMVEAIKRYSEELQELIINKSEESLKIIQRLDNSYPRRLISEKHEIVEEEYNERFVALNMKQEKLTKNGLYESKQEVLEYSPKDAKALLVYLNDLEEKLSVFDDLLERLELFTSILNERRFTYKTIHIDSNKGFYFKTINGQILELNELSSGEQHEVVLLYELIFNTAPNNIVLIDEPEISLHVAWQKEFVNDLLKIIELQGFQVMMATHSPSIINGRWDLVHTLEKNDD